jgi:hypothetical protein
MGAAIVDAFAGVIKWFILQPLGQFLIQYLCPGSSN